MKQTFQKILNFINNHRMIVLALLIVFIIPSLTQASQGTRVIRESGRTYYLYNEAAKKRLSVAVQQDDKNNLFYCLDNGLLGASTTSYTVYSDPALDKLPELTTKVLALGYPNNSIPGFTSQKDQYYITQVVVWATMTNQNLQLSPNNKYMSLDNAVLGVTGVDQAKATRVLAAAKDLLARAKALKSSEIATSIALSGPDTAVLKGDTLVAGPFKISGQNVTGASMAITVSGVNNPRIYNAQSQTITKIGYNQPFYVSFPKNSNAHAGALTIKLSGSKSVKVGLWYSPPTTRHQRLGRYGIHTMNHTFAPKTVKWSLPNEGIVEITKSDLTTAAPVPGATIEIYNASGVKVFGAVTNSQGKVTSPNLPAGKYTFKETVAPKGYQLSTEVGTFEIKQNGEIVKAKMTNKQIPDTPIVVVKIDRATKKPLAGAKIEVRDANNKVIFIGTTNSQGQVSVGKLKAGNYTYKELTPPAGYKLNAETYKFTIAPGQSAITLTIPNDLIPIIPDTPVQIIKIDKDTKEPLAGAEIEVYDSKNSKIYTGTTTADGKVQVGKLKAGDYTYKEVTPPAGYKPNTEVYKFTVKAGDATTLLTLANEIIPIGKIEISKTDLTTAAPLAGAVIEIYNAEGELVYASESDEQGLITTELVAGKYTFKETIAPVGYELSTEVGTFEIKQHGEIVKAEMKNKPLPEDVPVTPEVPPELPKTGPMEAVAAIIGIASVTLAIAYWHKSNRALKSKG